MECTYQEVTCLNFQIKCTSFPDILYNLANTADHDKMQHSLASHLGLRCMLKYLLNVLWTESLLLDNAISTKISYAARVAVWSLTGGTVLCH